MVSRELTPEESKDMQHDAIALDGIALVVNKENKVNDVDMSQIKDIYTGKMTEWSEVENK